MVDTWIVTRTAPPAAPVKASEIVDYRNLMTT